jgi:hypothetical protein
VASVTISLMVAERWRWLMVEIATVTLSLKIIYLIHSQMRVAHFEFWILSSLEWRINEMMKQLREIRSVVASEPWREPTLWSGLGPNDTGITPVTGEPATPATVPEQPRRHS